MIRMISTALLAASLATSVSAQGIATVTNPNPPTGAVVGVQGVTVGTAVIGAVVAAVVIAVVTDDNAAGTSGTR